MSSVPAYNLEFLKIRFWAPCSRTLTVQEYEKDLEFLANKTAVFRTHHSTNVCKL